MWWFVHIDWHHLPIVLTLTAAKGSGWRQMVHDLRGVLLLLGVVGGVALTAFTIGQNSAGVQQIPETVRGNVRNIELLGDRTAVIEAQHVLGALKDSLQEEQDALKFEAILAGIDSLGTEMYDLKIIACAQGGTATRECVRRNR